MTYGDKLVSQQYSFLKTSYAYYTLPSRGEWIFRMINWLLCSPSIFRLSPRVCVYDNFPLFFHLYVSQGPRCAAYSNEPITFFLSQWWILVVPVLLRARCSPSRARFCLKWRRHRGRCWSALQLKLNRHGRIFFCVSTVHLPQSSNALTPSLIL